MRGGSDWKYRISSEPVSSASRLSSKWNRGSKKAILQSTINVISANDTGCVCYFEMPTALSIFLPLY